MQVLVLFISESNKRELHPRTQKPSSKVFVKISVSGQWVSFLSIFQDLKKKKKKAKIISLCHWWYGMSQKALLCIEAKQAFSSNLKGPWNYRGKRLQYRDKLLPAHYWLLIIVMLLIPVSCCKGVLVVR